MNATQERVEVWGPFAGREGNPTPTAVGLHRICFLHHEGHEAHEGIRQQSNTVILTSQMTISFAETFRGAGGVNRVTIAVFYKDVVFAVLEIFKIDFLIKNR